MAILGLVAAAAGGSTPFQCEPRLVSHIGGADLAIAAAPRPDGAGSTVLLGDGHDLLVLRVIDGQPIAERFRLRLDGIVTRIMISDDATIAAVSTETRRLHLVHLAIDGTAIMRWTLPPSARRDMAFSRSHLLIAGDLVGLPPDYTGHTLGLTAIDAAATTPEPVTLGRLPIADPWLIAVSSLNPDFAYINDGRALLCVDVSSPVAPTLEPLTE